MRTEEEIKRDRELIGNSGISKRMSEYTPQVYCSCLSPIIRLSWFDKNTRVAYCDRCKLLVREKSNDY